MAELRNIIQRKIPERVVSRFAPGITGHLHLGHVVSALYVFGITRAVGGVVLLRAEDHDRTRFRSEFDDAIRDDLAWLGMVPDRSPWPGLGKLDPSLRQANREERYREKLNELAGRGLTYPCDCPRRRLVANDEGELVYDGHCRGRSQEMAGDHGFRIVMPDRAFAFEDLAVGKQEQNPARQTGDILARDRHDCWTYQFACTVDDLDQEVNLVIRGEDLLPSTGRQLALREYFSPAANAPVYLHHPLLTDPSGQKLGKRFMSESITSRRTAGISAETVLGEAAFAAGKIDGPRPMELAEALALFSNWRHLHGGT
ncbi:MAG: hypothetical protein RIQ81_2278 [Pseudomonadota bacterium]